MSEYLGDGVVADFDGIMIKLTADGTKVIWLEHSTYAALVSYAERCWPVSAEE